MAGPPVSPNSLLDSTPKVQEEKIFYILHKMSVVVDEINYGTQRCIKISRR